MTDTRRWGCALGCGLGGEDDATGVMAGRLLCTSVPSPRPSRRGLGLLPAALREAHSTLKEIPWARGMSRDQLMVLVWRRM